MKEKYWLCKRGNIYFCLDSETGKRESLRTGNKEEAKQIIQAKNNATRQPAMNIVIARAYLVGADPKLMERRWAFVMEEFCSTGKESTRQRRRRAVKSKAFNSIRNKKLIETTAEDFLAVFKSSGSFANHILRCLHNLALGTLAAVHFSRHKRDDSLPSARRTGGFLSISPSQCQSGKFSSRTNASRRAYQKYSRLDSKL